MARVRKCYLSSRLTPGFATPIDDLPRLSSTDSHQADDHALKPSFFNCLTRASTDNTAVHSSESRPPRHSLGPIGIPNRRDALAAHVRWARILYYLHHSGRYSRVVSSVRAVADVLETRGPASPVQRTGFSTLDNLNIDLLYVGGQFD